MPSEDDHALVVLMTCRDDAEAMGVRAVLESEGIFVLVQGEHHRAIAGPLLGAMIELRVMVRRGDLEHARVLIEEAAYAEHLPPEPSDEPVEDASIQRFQASVADRDEPDEGEARLSPRRPGVAIAAAIFIPLGTGHIYARRPLTGIAIGAAELLDYILWFRGWFVLPAVVCLIAFDAIWSTVAIRRDLARGRLDG